MRKCRLDDVGYTRAVIAGHCANRDGGESVRFRSRHFSRFYLVSLSNRPAGSAKFRMVRDYSPTRSINWVPTQTEGSYEIEVSARNLSTGETDVQTSSYVVESLGYWEQPRNFSNFE